jgi:hypothetical protein
LAGELLFFWHNADRPEQRTIVNRPSIINFSNGNPYAFVTSAEGYLDLYFWDGNNWYWHYAGQPPGVAAASEPAVISFVHEGEVKLYAFVTGNDGQLYEYHWSASSGWAWAAQPHSPLQGVTLASGPAATVYRHENQEQIYIFIMDSDGQLQERHWNAASGLSEWGYPHGAP